MSSSRMFSSVVDLGEQGVPLLDRHDHAAPSVFRPENMLREARRQKGLKAGGVPPICLLDPDGDIVRFVRTRFGATLSPHWACYHTQMWEWTDGGLQYGIIGAAVGGAFAVLVAEQLFVSGCELLVSLASAGQIAARLQTPCHILIERALRDEGTSHHYMPPMTYAEADPELFAIASEALQKETCCIHIGSTWTTDAPFRETIDAIETRRHQGILAVEMEAASLYAFGRSCRKPVICVAQVTNQLGCIEGDFEKGDGDGACASLDLVTKIATAWMAVHTRAQSQDAAPASAEPVS